MLTLLLHIVIRSFTAENFSVYIFNNTWFLVFPGKNIARKSKSNSIGSLVLVKMPNVAGSYLELRGLTLDL